MKPLIFTLCCIFAGISTSVSAACTSDTSDGRTYFIAHFQGFSPPEFDPNAVPVGGVIYSVTGNINYINKNGSYPTFKCDPLVDTYVIGVGLESNKVYATAIPNIGIRIRDGSTVVPFTLRTNSSSTRWDESFLRTIELVKTGEITAGGAIGGTYMQYRAGSQAGPLQVDFRFGSPVFVRPRVPTCKVATPQVTVRMADTVTAAFKGPGTTTLARPFDLSLICSGGAKNSSTKAFVTLTDVTAPGNTSTTLSLTKDSTAAGVGIQVLKDNALLSFGPDSAAIGNMNQWYAGTVAEGQAQLKIPLSARYIQIAEKVTPGSANARATFTMSYQ
ncbi:TPA: fimbrial protein [Burkholderia cenocepacia]|uniref:fimbrial protein n=1 Tax=Burkholderia cenocepacia TaxID=95486 RepID=UPI001B955FBA|nr:fimbrial protein [Burkholderia cenocepacia]MBR8198879.1 fimbrial protein [Burkholderia cenocepacia]HDV6324776.1 fimbrial protein [Burkholderia cenocepacia]HDV6350817.1 fimbrial protein [Burkholderia cenocepacia]